MVLLIPINRAACGGAALLPPASQGSPDLCRGKTIGRSSAQAAEQECRLLLRVLELKCEKVVL